MQLGDRVRHLREMKGLTQKSLADAIGLTAGHVHKIEAGAVLDMKLSTLRALAEALGTTIDPLVYGDVRASQAQMRAVEDRMFALGQLPATDETRRELRELSARLSELKDDEVYPPLRLATLAPAASKRRGPKPRRERESDL